jgi:NAD(P)-dependent dehydrogenase (short-subunit alcohol dehydrogenase family)
MVKRGKGRIVWVSSREGQNTNPFTGHLSASKHAVEAIAETMSLELQEFGIEVATVNPGPFLTGFNTPRLRDVEGDLRLGLSELGRPTDSARALILSLREHAAQRDPGCE